MEICTKHALPHFVCVFLYHCLFAKLSSEPGPIMPQSSMDMYYNHMFLDPADIPKTEYRRGNTNFCLIS